MAAQINIIGDGLAACCAAHLLIDRGFSVSLHKTGRPKPARLLVSDATQSLLCDIFRAPDLFAQAPRIRRRIVRWGPHAETLDLPHRGLVVSEMDLLDRLWRQTPVAATDPASPAAWSLVATSDCAALPALQSFGARCASVASVVLTPPAAQDACWVESLPDGWLFLLPAGDARGALIATGYTPEKLPETLLDQSVLVAPQIVHLETAASRAFPAFPQILTEVCGPDWLALGSAAMTFDPLCGEGAGHAARVALLASAVLQAVANGQPRANLLDHYSTRLLQGFLRHLQVCLPFYQGGGSGQFWKSETASLERGIAWAQQRLRRSAPFQYRFAGYELEPLSPSPSRESRAPAGLEQ